MSELQIGYAAMLEQFAPAEAVALSAYAEEHGFSGVMAADHFQPWVPAQGESSFSPRRPVNPTTTTMICAATSTPPA